MSSYTKVNLKEVDDMAPKFGLSPGLESRFARRALELEKTGMSYYRIAPGVRTPFGHTHAEQEEVYVVLSGAARIKIGDDVVELWPLDAVRVPSGTMRCLEGGPEGAEVIAYGAPTSAEDDSTLVQGWWND
jgi:mannose-6-phosphate isomerase-like protein (cupin superfamily)